MKLGFLLNAIIEVVGGIYLYFNPSFLGISYTNVTIFKMYGMIAVCFGLVSFLMWKYYEENQRDRAVYLVFLGFQMAISFFLFGAYSNGEQTLFPALCTHGCLFGILFVLYLKDIKPNIQ